MRIHEEDYERLLKLIKMIHDNTKDHFYQYDIDEGGMGEFSSISRDLIMKLISKILVILSGA